MKINQKILDDLQGLLRTLREERQADRVLINQLQAKSQELERALAQRGPGFSRHPDVPGSEDNFSFARLIGAMINRSWAGAEHEREVLVAGAKKRNVAPGDIDRILDGKMRAATLGSDATLGNLVPNQVMSELIPLLRSALILTRMGVRMLPNLQGSPVEIARALTDGVGYWVGENVSITPSDQTTDMMRFRPHKAAGLTQISNTLIRAGGNGAEQFVRESLTAVLARTIQKAYFNGTGVGAQPLGLANQTGIQTKTSIGNITIVQMQKFIEALRNSNVPVEDPSVMWVMHPGLLGEIEQLAASDTGARQGSPILTLGDATAGTPSRILGLPYVTSTDIVTTELWLGYWRWTVLADWGGIEIALSDQAGTAFQNDQTWIRVIQEVDVGVARPEAVIYGSGVTVSTAL